ncbi:MAG: hypothetical protein JWO96_188 [Candidatus Saccharibacteria bacterium]|nr:hypothetical protein [Candidatus Saccharibacteria bacterium]
MIIWQVLFILLSTTWLFAPHLNHFLSYRTSLISQYETPTQPYSLLMRVADLSGGLLLLGMGFAYLKKIGARTIGYLLIITGTGMALDPILTTTCKVALGECVEYYSLAFVLHATETVMTASAFFVLGVYDAWLRKKMVSIVFVFFQIAYFTLFLTQYATHAHYNTLSQFLYQLVLVVWACWFCRDFLINRIGSRSQSGEAQLIKYFVATWAFLNGILAIVISFADIHLVGRIRGIYFAGDSAWLAQHSVIIGVILLYLSRHLARGERRARQIFLAIAAIETLKYSVVTPNAKLLLLYLLTFCLLFIWRDVFDRGTIPMTWRIRAKDLVFMISALLVAVLTSLVLLDSDTRIAGITTRAIDNFVDYSLRTKIVPKNHLQSVLLAHTISAFILVSALTILWILFKPSRKVGHAPKNYQRVKELLSTYSDTPEDYFKLWPTDKNYFWDAEQTGFIAYKISGPVVFALADPIAPQSQKQKLLEEFVSWAKGRSLRVCFLPVYENSLELYEKSGLAILQIGASAIIKSEEFLNETANDKWWRWQKNRALKAGYEYSPHLPPHSGDLLQNLRAVSDAWLGKGGHKERGFALGYYDEAYLQKCMVHSLKDESGRIIAFTNQLPHFKQSATATVDLLRYEPDAQNTMPYLLYKTIESTYEQGYSLFDLGFVPFAAAKSPVLSIARILGSGRFSARGLEQFKNKFDPHWQPNYMAYDGDLADLALIAINLEKAMEQKV